MEAPLRSSPNPQPPVFPTALLLHVSHALLLTTASVPITPCHALHPEVKTIVFNWNGSAQQTSQNAVPYSVKSSNVKSLQSLALIKHTVITGKQDEDQLSLCTNTMCTDDSRKKPNTKIIRAVFLQDYISLLHIKVLTHSCISPPCASLRL